MSLTKHEEAHPDTHIFSVFLEIIATLNYRNNNRGDESEMLRSQDIS
jgi:hypothetical protein